MTISDAPFDKHNDGNIYGSVENCEVMRDELNKVGSGFCLAKWTQVTMHLGSGKNHSCHHPPTHTVSVEEVTNNPAALHNSEYKKQQRRDMLNGIRPKECDFCWRTEDGNTGNSDRYIKSLSVLDDYDSISRMSGDEDVYPRDLEISFSNVCNLKCSYCGPWASSMWNDEAKLRGGIPVGTGMHNEYIPDPQIKNREHNPYVEAFWKWLPDALPHIRTFRVTGGEPLLSKQTFKVMEYLLENPMPELVFSVNSNASVPDDVWHKFVNLTNRMIDEGAVKRIVLFVSAESTGDAAEYSRYGMSWDKLKANVEYFLDNTRKTRVTFMAAYNVLSVTTFLTFLEYVLDLKRRYNYSHNFDWLEDHGVDPHMGEDLPTHKYRGTISDGNTDRVWIDIPYVRQPDFLDARIIDKDTINKFVIPAVDFMFKNAGSSEWHGSMGFREGESMKLKRILLDLLKTVDGDMKTDHRKKIYEMRYRFRQFISTYDSRRGTSFVSVFPELKGLVDE